MDPHADDRNEFWFCLTHHRVEGREGCRNADRLGPFGSAAEAERALERVEERNEAWAAEDRRWDEAGTDPVNDSGPGD
jgi:hypothetical protein